MGMPNRPYESATSVREYLLFHYGTRAQVLPWPEGPESGLDFPARCAALLLRHADPGRRDRALDLGCAVGRSAFELAAGFTSVLGIDLSPSFIQAALALRAAGGLQTARVEEGDRVEPVWVEVPSALPRAAVAFEIGDACALRADLGTFDAVLLANLICRVADPARLLAELPARLRPGGVVVITTPATWSEAYTPREKWLGGTARSTLDGLRAALEPSLQLAAVEELPFLLREHARKYQWAMAQASVWRKPATERA
jgi:putative 4-mercaptohistidine N1-methyltranferase